MITFISEKQASEFVLYKKNEFIEKNTLKSLNDVEYFLNNFSHTLKYIKLINLLK